MAVARWLLGIVATSACAAAVAQAADPAPARNELARVSLPSVGLRARDIAVVVNDADPASVEVGRYYAAQRGIAADHVVHVRFPPGRGDGLRRLRARAGGARCQGRRRRAGLRARLDAAVPGRVHVGDGGVRASASIRRRTAPRVA